MLDDAKAAAAPFAEALDAEITELLRLEALIEPPTNLQSCHRDLRADNILPIPTGGVCVIDWENCGLADPAQELPMVMIDFASGDRAGSPSCTCRTWRLAAPLGSAATARSRW